MFLLYGMRGCGRIGTLGGIEQAPSHPVLPRLLENYIQTAERFLLIHSRFTIGPTCHHPPQKPFVLHDKAASIAPPKSEIPLESKHSMLAEIFPSSGEKPSDIRHEDIFPQPKIRALF